MARSTCSWTYMFLALSCCIASAISCRPDWVQFEESCYGFSEHPETWEDALDVCMAASAKLAEIETSEENEFLKSQARLKGGHFWLGASDMFNEGTWTWMSTGALLRPFSDWPPGEPNDAAGNQDCLNLSPNYDYQWDDGTCEAPRTFICETGIEETVIG